MDPCFSVTALLQTRHERDVGGQDFYLAEGDHIRPGSETPKKNQPLTSKPMQDAFEFFSPLHFQLSSYSGKNLFHESVYHLK